MTDSPIDTLLALCQLERRVPLNVFAARVGYHRRTIWYHLEQLEALGLIRKRSRGFWVPTFEGPYTYEALQARVIVHRAAMMASDLPWLAERIRQILDDGTAG